MEPVTLTVPDACKVIGIGRTKLYELIEGGALETVRIGQRRLIKTSSIRRLVGEPA